MGASKRGDVSYCQHGHECDPKIPNIPGHLLRVQKGGVGEHSGRGVLTKVPILTGSYINIESTVRPVHFPWWRDVHEYMKFRASILFYHSCGYGFIGKPWGDVDEQRVARRVMKFANHGCNGQYVMGVDSTLHEDSAECDNAADVLAEYSDPHEVYNPVLERNIE